VTSIKKQHQEYLEHISNIRKYKEQILQVFHDFLDNPTHQVTTEVNESYDSFVKTLIRHFECKKIEMSDNDNEKDMLFGEMDDEKESENQVAHSYWGKQKVTKKSSTFGIPMNYIPRVPGSI
jgi:hypothetical protein